MVYSPGNPNIYSDELNYLFRERIYREAGNLVRDFRRIEIAIFRMLSISDHWEYLSKGINNAYRHNEETFVHLGKELAKKYHVSYEDLPGYITRVDRCLFIASYISRLIFSPRHFLFPGVHEAPRQHASSFLKEIAGWEALHATTFLKHGNSKL
jgi:hypothetical protein